MKTQRPTPSTTDVLDQIEACIREMILGLEADWSHLDRQTGGRPRVLPALCLWSGLIICILRGFSSQLALHRLLSSTGLWHFPRVAVSDQAIYNRLERDGCDPLKRLFEGLSGLLRQRLEPYVDHTLAPFASNVYALDATTLDKLRRHLPELREQSATVLGGKLAGLFDLRRQQWSELRYVDDPQQNDKVIARDFLEALPPGSLLLCDMGYFAFEWFDDLTHRGYWYISRLRAKSSYEVIHVNYQQGETLDAIVWLGAYRADRARHAVRLLQFRVGQQLFRYITNVRDPAQLPLKMVAQLYARRWDIEMAFRLVKQHLNLHLIWSGKPQVIQQQLWAIFIVAQIFQALRIEIAAKAEVDLFDVSIALLIQYFPQLAAQGYDPITFFVEEGRRAGFIRPARRVTIRAPEIPLSALQPIPPDLLLTRTPRYAGRKC